jgi:hypothetical protein
MVERSLGAPTEGLGRSALSWAANMGAKAPRLADPERPFVRQPAKALDV